MKARGTERSWGASDKFRQPPGTADRRLLIRQALKTWASPSVPPYSGTGSLGSAQREDFSSGAEEDPGQARLLSSLQLNAKCFPGCCLSFLPARCLLAHCLHTLQKQLWMLSCEWLIFIHPPPSKAQREVRGRWVGKSVRAGRLEGKLNSGFWRWLGCCMHQLTAAEVTCTGFAQNQPVKSSAWVREEFSRPHPYCRS